MKKTNKQNNVVNEYARHGDLLIKKIEGTDLELVKMDKVVLAEGEHTGHAHRLTVLDDNAQIEFRRQLDKMVFRVSNGQVQLTHEEHTQIVFNPGTYEVTFENEWDYFQNEIRRVVD